MSYECPECGFFHPPVEHGSCPIAKTKQNPDFEKKLKVITNAIIANKQYLDMDKFTIELFELIQKYKN